jgi:hypothetical protein
MRGRGTFRDRHSYAPREPAALPPRWNAASAARLPMRMYTTPGEAKPNRATGTIYRRLYVIVSMRLSG